MTKQAHILYATAWLLYIFFSVLMFPIWGTSTGIPIFILTGIGAWLYGLTKGLIIVALIIIYHTILYSFVYAHCFEIYQTKLSSPILLIYITYLSDQLRRNRDHILRTNLRLDQLVMERNSELLRLTKKLLENHETIKIKQAKLLHDGIGQQLTGIQLMSTSLAEQLLQEKKPIASNIDFLRIQTNKLHNHVRKISRMLFPVRMEQVGLISALDELASCLQEMKPVTMIDLKTYNVPPIPTPLMLQLYRICQEAVLLSIDRLKADQIQLKLSADDFTIRITITHNGCSSDSIVQNASLNLIKHRLRMVQGKLSNLSETQNPRSVQFIIPIPPPELI